MTINPFLAYKRLKGIVLRTPLVYSDSLSRMFDRDIYLKLEVFQVTGSFKVRGVFNKFLKDMEKGIHNKCYVTVSTGNHGLAVAYASSKLGIDATVVVPNNVSILKLERIRTITDKVLVCGDNYDEAEKAARKISKEKGCDFVSPYNDIDIIEGQSTIGVEILYDLPNIDTVIVPAGGGGLISGVAYSLKTVNPEINVIGVQSEASKPLVESFKAKKIVKVELKDSVADGLHGNVEENSITLDFILKYVDDIKEVSEDSIIRSMKEIYMKEGLIVEGAAATSLAALLEKNNEIPGEKIALVLTGRNIDPKHFELLK